MTKLAFPARAAEDFSIGFQVSTATVRELEAVAAAGATHVRWQPSWDGVEDFDTGTMSLSKQNAEALAACARLGLQPILVAGYGPPRKAMPALTVTKAFTFGEHVLHVSGDLASIEPRSSFLGEIYLTQRGSYYGSIVETVDAEAGTVTLGAAVLAGQKVGTPLKHTRLRYPPVFEDTPTNPGIVAYLRYVSFLAEAIANAGCRGHVALWNEDVWGKDPWNHGILFYDSGKAPVDVKPINRMNSICRAALDLELPDGVRLINGATDKSGASSACYLNPPPTPAQAADVLPIESIHDYGDNPEQQAWRPDTFEAINPEDKGSNFRLMAKRHAALGNGMQIASTECGTEQSDDERQAIYLVRRVLSHWGMGIPITSIYSLTTKGFGVMLPGTKVAPALTPRLAYTVLQQLMGLLRDLGASGPAAVVPTLTSTEGETFPLLTLPLLGESRSLLFAWQATARPSKTAKWANVSAPAPASATFYLPPGAQVESASHLVSGSSAGWSIAPCQCGAAQQLTLSDVGEDPVVVNLA